MKHILVTACLLIVSVSTWATEQDLTLPEHWMCQAQGNLSVGTPAGPISSIVLGYGETEFEAMSDANQNCFNQGMSMCRVTYCVKRK